MHRREDTRQARFKLRGTQVHSQEYVPQVRLETQVRHFEQEDKRSYIWIIDDTRISEMREVICTRTNSFHAITIAIEKLARKSIRERVLVLGDLSAIFHQI